MNKSNVTSIAGINDLSAQALLINQLIYPCGKKISAVLCLARNDQEQKKLATLGKGDFFGEMALFEKEVRSATVRARGEVRVLTIDKKNLLRRIHEDPTLAFRMLRTLSQRIRDLNSQLVELKASR